jgi:hypothetical protein
MNCSPDHVHANWVGPLQPTRRVRVAPLKAAYRSARIKRPQASRVQTLKSKSKLLRPNTEFCQAHCASGQWLGAAAAATAAAPVFPCLADGCQAGSGSGLFWHTPRPVLCARCSLARGVQQLVATRRARGS